MQPIEFNHVQEQIRKNNPWFTASQWAWAEQPETKPVFEKRFAFFQTCFDHILKAIGAPVSVLDMGCGDGYWLARMQSIRGLHLRGMDYNPLRIERARRFLSQIPLEVSTIEDLPARSVQCVFLNHVLEHVQDDISLLKKVRRLLPTRGYLILGVPNEGSRLQRLWLQRSHFQTDHVHFYTEKNLLPKLDQCGFDVLKTFREVFFLFNYPWFYQAVKSSFGFRFLELLTTLFPHHCSGLIFLLQKS